MKPKILIVDDEPSICAFLQLGLNADYEVFTSNTPDDAKGVMDEVDINLVILDLMLGEFSGIDLLKEIKVRSPDIAVIMMTAFGSIESSVEAMKLGAFTYLCKPINFEELNLHLKQALTFRNLSEKVIQLSQELESRYRYGEMIGKDSTMQHVYQLIEKLKDVETSVLVSGESGTGKELVSRAIHYSGQRKNENFVTVNCGAIPEGLLEEEFFGHKKGSFTGAVADKAGKFVLADKGTLFLDEVGEMPVSLQVKLLRVLQQKEVAPIGSNEVRKIDVRVISATNQNLLKLVEEGKFRRDLYYRLRVVEIELPSLKNRRQDIPLLCKHFLEKYNRQLDKNIEGITDEVEKILMSYNYPGNIRELANAIEYAVVLSDGKQIVADDLPEELRNITSSFFDTVDIDLIISKYLTNIPLKEIERALIKANLERFGQKRALASKAMGISERSLYYKIQE